MNTICDSTCEKGPLRGKIEFSLDVKMSDNNNHARNLFYCFIIGIYSMSPTFRRAVSPEAFLCARAWRSNRATKLGTNARSFTKLLFMANYVETIMCATNGNFRNVI